MLPCSFDDDDVGRHVLGCRVDILGTNCNTVKSTNAALRWKCFISKSIVRRIHSLPFCFSLNGQGKGSHRQQRDVTTKSATSIPHRETWPPSQQHIYHIHRDVTTKSATSIQHTQRRDHQVNNIYTTHTETWPPSQQHLYHTQRHGHQVNNIYTTHRELTTKSATSVSHTEKWPPSQQHLYHIQRRNHQVSNISTT